MSGARPSQYKIRKPQNVKRICTESNLYEQKLKFVLEAFQKVIIHILTIV